MYTLIVDSTELKRFTDRLRKMHRSDLPIVVRQTLNDTAFDVHKNTLPTKFKDEFTIRNKTFLRSHSGVQKADGFSINTMKSAVGITPKGSEAAEGLTMQELGGNKTKPFIYVNKARVSNSNIKPVKAQNYFNKKRVLHGLPNRARSEKSQFVANAYMALKADAFMFGTGKRGKTLMQIDFIRQNIRRRSMFIKATPIADYQKGRNIRIDARHFLKEASLMSYQKQGQFFMQNAVKRFKK